MLAREHVDCLGCDARRRYARGVVIEIVWEFVAHPGSQAELARVYGEHGAWARLYPSSPRYLGTTLARDLTDDRRFLEALE